MKVYEVNKAAVKRAREFSDRVVQLRNEMGLNEVEFLIALSVEYRGALKTWPQLLAGVNQWIDSRTVKDKDAGK